MTGPGGAGDGPGDGAPIRPVGGDIQEPRRIRGAAPIYPDLARRAHVEGKVVLECVIDTDGRVTDLRVVSGHPMLAEAALDAVRSWVYSPTRLNGRPVNVIMTVTVRFSLHPS
jgi:protein TonB